MAVWTSTITVTTTATQLPSAAGDTEGDLWHKDAAVKNVGATTVYVGGDSVTASTGFPLSAGETIMFNNIVIDSWPYVVVATGTGAVAVIQVGV